MKSLINAFALACLASFGIAMHASAQIDAVEGPIPTSPDSTIFGAANVPHAALSVNLDRYGYVEEEYFIKGRASAFRHTKSGLEPVASGLPYTTRIIVRRPKEPARFSGVVHFEPIHPTQGVTFSWFVLSRYLMSRGDIYVAVALGDADAGWSGSPSSPNQTAPVGELKVTKWFEPKRYEALSWPQEEGIRFDVMSQIGRKLRSNDKDNPLRGMTVRAMLVSGWSYTGSLQRVFINEGFHDRSRLADGKPVFDAYLIGVSSRWNSPGYLPLYNDEPFVPVNDPRRALKKTDARVIEFLTESEVGLNANHDPEAPDNDNSIGGYRVYELGGVIHVSSLIDPSKPNDEEPALTQLVEHGYPKRQVSKDPVFSCSVPQSDLPMGAFVRAAVDNLRHWVLDGQPPPHAKRLIWKGNDLVRDAVGNVVGGIRAAEYQVPIARYGRYEGNDKPNCQSGKQYPNIFLLRNEFSRDELTRRYGSAAKYVTLYNSAIDRLVEQRWLLQDDALRLKAKALEDARRQFGSDAEKH